MAPPGGPHAQGSPLTLRHRGRRPESACVGLICLGVELVLFTVEVTEIFIRHISGVFRLGAERKVRSEYDAVLSDNDA
ncbi:MAG: hypothetical protein ACYCUC_05185 [Candidatus Dormibacteria bacterium]